MKQACSLSTEKYFVCVIKEAWLTYAQYKFLCIGTPIGRCSQQQNAVMTKVNDMSAMGEVGINYTGTYYRHRGMIKGRLPHCGGTAYRTMH